MKSKLGSCEVKGDREMRRRLAALVAQFPQAIKKAVYIEAELIMADSKENYVPKDDGVLYRSGIVEPPVIDGINIWVRMGFGGAAMDYAEVVHEHPSGLSPAVWKGKVINWSIPGTGPKYLEIPFRKAEKGQANRIARTIKAETGL